MPQFDIGAVSAVEEFATSMGVMAVPDDDGAYTFEFSESGRLSMLASEDGARVLVSLTRAVLVTDIIGKGSVMAAGGYNPVTSHMVRPGITSASRPVLAVDCPMRGLDLPTLDAAFQTQRTAYEEVGL